MRIVKLTARQQQLYDGLVNATRAGNRAEAGRLRDAANLVDRQAVIVALTVTTENNVSAMADELVADISRETSR